MLAPQAPYALSHIPCYPAILFLPVRQGVTRLPESDLDSATQAGLRRVVLLLPPT